MIPPYAYQREVVIANKRAARSFGHWNDRAPARPEAARPKAGGPLPPASNGRAAPAPRGNGAPPPSSSARPQWVRPGAGEDTRSRLERLAQRREDGELMRDLADGADLERPATPSAATRSALRALADRQRDDALSPEPIVENPEEHLWNRVLGIAAPMVTFEPPDRRAR